MNSSDATAMRRKLLVLIQQELQNAAQGSECVQDQQHEEEQAAFIARLIL